MELRRIYDVDDHHEDETVQGCVGGSSGDEPHELYYGTADIPSFVPDYFGGHSWEHPEVYSKHSAMFNIKGVTTPTLVQHGEADVRVPISQGYELYNALKAQGVPTRMIVLPRQPHGPNEPKMQIAAMQSNLDWFDKYLK